MLSDHPPLSLSPFAQPVMEAASIGFLFATPPKSAALRRKAPHGPHWTSASSVESRGQKQGSAGGCRTAVARGVARRLWRLGVRAEHRPDLDTQPPTPSH